MGDEGKLHALEALVVGTMFFAAAGFVLTFETTSSPDAPTTDKLEGQSEDALSTFYDKPLDDPMYGNNTMSKRLAESLSGDAGPLSDQLNATMPDHTLYNLFLDNGYAKQPVYEQFDPDDSTPTTPVSRLIEPKWSYTFTATNFAKYPEDPSVQPTKMGVYTLPVSTGAAVRTGGAEVDVVVHGDMTNPQLDQDSSFRLDRSFTVRQAGSGDSIPHASMYFNDSNDDPHAFAGLADEWDSDGDVGADCENGCTHWFNLTINETAGDTIPAGTHVNVTVPRGWTANASGGSDYSRVSSKHDEDHRGDLSLELDSNVSDEVRTLKFNATYHEDQYEYYTFHASMPEPVYGDAEFVVRAEDQTGGYTGGDFPHPRVSAPRSMGSSENGTWVVAVVNPESILASNDVGGDDVNQNSTVVVHNLTFTQPEGKGLFDDVSGLSISACSGTWKHISDQKIKWKPSSDCEVDAGEGLDFAARVESNPDTETGLTLTDRFHPSASYESGWGTDVDRTFTDGLPRQFVPPDTVGALSQNQYPGWPNSSHPDLPATGPYNIDTDSVHGTTLLKGSGDYETVSATDVNTYQVALGLGSVDAQEPRVAIGETATVDINVESLLYHLSTVGAGTSLETSIYPPWSMGDRDPVFEKDHVEQDVDEQGLHWVFHDDVDGDGDEDVVAITKETSMYTLEGGSGSKLAGYQLAWDQAASAAIQFDLNSTTTAYAIGFDDGTVRLVDEDFDEIWARSVTAPTAVQDLSAEYDWDGGGQTDIVAGSEGKSWFTYGEERTAAQDKKHQVSASQGGPTRVEGANLLEEEPDASETVVSLGKGAAAKVAGVTVSTENVFYTHDRNEMVQKTTDLDPNLLEALKGPTVYRQDPVLQGYNDSMGWTSDPETKDAIWKSSGTSGFEFVGSGDLTGNGDTDLVGGNASINVGDVKDDPGRVQAYNGSDTDASSATTIAHGSTVLDMATPTRSHAYYVTDDGLLEFTYDAWQTRYYYLIAGQPIEQFPTAESIEFVNKSHGWMVGDNDDIWYTEDRSQSWTHMSDYNIENRLGVSLSLDEVDLRYEDLHINETEYGVVVGGKCTTEDSCSTPWIAWTEDGGENWKKADVDTGLLDDFRFLDVDFPTNETGYAVGTYGTVQKTTDGGDTWSEKKVDAFSATKDYRPNLHAVHFINETHGFIAGEEETLMRTTDGGDNWHEVTVIHPVERDDYEPTLYDISFATDKHGYAVGEDGTKYRTNDGGERWIPGSPKVPSDEVAEVEFRSVETPTEHVGYASGSENEGADRFWSIFQAYRNDTAAVSETLTGINDWHANNGDGLEEVRSARVDPTVQTRGATNVTYHVSNDGCDTWNEVPKEDPQTVNHRYDTMTDYEWVDFADPSKTDLCWKAVFTSDGVQNVYYRSPFLYNITVEYRYKESGDSEWHTRNATYEFSDAAIRNESATSAAWNVTEGTISMDYVDRLWWNRVKGSVNGVTTADMDHGDGYEDVLAWTGIEPGDRDCPYNCSTSYDNRVYAFDGDQGEVLRNTTKLPGPVESLQTVNLTTATGDDMMDFVVTYGNATSEPKVRAYDGSDFTEIWTIDVNGTALDWTHGTYDTGSSIELSWGSAAASASEQPVVETHEPDHGTPAWEWTTRPSFVGNYTVNYDVPRHSLFGPYIVETTVSWDAVDGSGTQTARLFDYFSVTTPDGEIPESPIYRLDLVSAYEGQN